MISLSMTVLMAAMGQNTPSKFCVKMQRKCDLNLQQRDRNIQREFDIQNTRS